MSSDTLLENFLSATLDDTLTTEYKLCPETVDTTLIVQEAIFKTGTSVRDGEERVWAHITLRFLVNDEKVISTMKRDEVVVYGNTLFLNLTPKGALDPARNQPLAKTLKYCGIKPTKGMSLKEILESFEGAVVLGNIVHEPMKRGKEVLLDTEGNVRLHATVPVIRPLG